jgi:hypothetical protein
MRQATEDFTVVAKGLGGEEADPGGFWSFGTGGRGSRMLNESLRTNWDKRGGLPVILRELCLP